MTAPLGLTIQPREFVERFDWKYFDGFKHKIALFSGGRDSTVVLHLVKQRYQDDMRALFVNTTCTIPDVVRHVKQVCELLDVPLDIIRPRVNFFDLVKRWGAPTVRRRWCMNWLKQKPIKEYVDKLRRKGRTVVLFDGRRAAESWMRKRFFKRVKDQGYPPGANFHPILHTWCASPIWNWSDEEVARYTREHNLPISPIYRTLGAGGDCICPVFKNKDFYPRLRVHYPHIFEALVKLEAQFYKGGSFARRNVDYYYLRDLKKQALLDEFVERK